MGSPHYTNRALAALLLALLFALAVPVGAAEDAALGDDGNKQDPSSVIRFRTISLSLAAEAAGYAVGTGSGDAPLQYEAEFESGEMVSRTSQFRAVSADVGSEQAPGTVYATRWRYADVPEGREYVLHYGVTASPSSSKEADRYLTLPWDRNIAGIAPPSGGHNNSPVLTVTSDFCMVDSLHLPSQALHWQNGANFAALQARSLTIKVTYHEGNVFFSRVDQHIFPVGDVRVFVALVWGDISWTSYPNLVVLDSVIPSGPLTIEVTLPDFEAAVIPVEGRINRSYQLISPMVLKDGGRAASQALESTSGPLPPPPGWLKRMALKEYLDGKALLSLDLFEAVDMDGDGEITELDLMIFEAGGMKGAHHRGKEDTEENENA